MKECVESGNEASMRRLTKGEGTMAENAYASALRQFDKAVRYLNIKAGVAEYLRAPKRELIVNFPVEMDSGSVGEV